MNYDLQADLQSTRNALDRLGELVQPSVEDLRAANDFQLRCYELAELLPQCIADVPPPEPTPPVTQTRIVVNDYTLARAGWVRHWVEHHWLGRVIPKARVLTDAYGMVPVAEPVERVVTLPDPMLPGSPERDFVVELEVHEPVAVPIESSPGAFEYRLQRVRGKFTVHMDAVPPDRPLTPQQARYVARREEIAKEVRDIRTLLRDLGDEVGAIKGANSHLEREAGDLAAAVDRLSGPPDFAERFEEVRQAIEALERELPAVEQEISRRSGELSRVKAEIQAICPELQL